ncbi:MAG: hypothetical protein RL065_2036 [Bacteroidota bacterium]|jgi:release factor glutamine methyltransferase
MNLFKFYIEKLTNIYEFDEANAITHQVFKQIISNNKQDYLLLEIENISTTIKFAQLQNILFRLVSNEPLQHILGYVYFLDGKIKVNKNVLIPRPETEELVFMVNQKLKKENNLSVIDICSGSGCIAISVAKLNPSFKLFGLEKSKRAFELSSKNSELNNVNVSFINDDIFSWQPFTKFDVIISNPPYVMHSEKNLMDNNVLGFEPHMALFVDDSNPLIFYAEIKRIALQSLKINGKIFLEINPILADETALLFQDENFSSQIVLDMYGKKRFVFAAKLYQFQQ